MSKCCITPDEFTTYPRRQRRAWKALMLRAVKGHETDVLAFLQDLAQVGTPITRLNVGAGGQVAVIRLPAWRLTLSPTSPYQTLPLASASSVFPLELVGAGRYGRSWWISIRTPVQAVTLLSGRVSLVRDEGRINDDWSSVPPSRHLLSA